MSSNRTTTETEFTVAGWQGITVEVPPGWNIGAISGDEAGGYVRFDDDTMPRLEIKWSSETGFVNLEAVIDRYLRDLRKGRKKGQPEVEVERDVQLMGRGRRKGSPVKCFRWRAEAEGYGAAWVCKDCGRTVIAQVMSEADRGEAARELAARVLLSIRDHPTDDWVLWSAYGLSCQVPRSFRLTGQKLMAGLIEMTFARDTETIRVARWGMASVLLKKRDLAQWLGAEEAKTFRKHAATPQDATIHDHPGLHITGGVIAGVQLLLRFWRHCTGKLYADRLVGRAWHCQPTNKLYYVETFVDRANVGLADQLVERIQCH